MISEQEISFIQKCFERLYQKREPRGNFLPAKEAPFEKEDGGVPPEMQTGSVSEDGWVKWKIIESILNENDVTTLEENYKIKFPLLFRAYLIADFQLFGELVCNDFSITLPVVPSDNPFGDLRQTLDSALDFFRERFIPFGFYEDWGMLCFDTKQSLENGDCAVVMFDHEILELNENEATFIFGSFRELMEEMFLK